MWWPDVYAAVIAVEALVIVVLVAALLWGQPAAATAQRAQLVSYRATIDAIPTSTPRPPCRGLTPYPPPSC
jgi:hypothetical protein